MGEKLRRVALIFHLCQWFKTVTCRHSMLITSTRNIKLLENSATAEVISLQRGWTLKLSTATRGGATGRKNSDLGPGVPIIRMTAF